MLGFGWAYTWREVCVRFWVDRYMEGSFNYCAETWHHCSKRCAAKLEKVNERAIRFVCNANKSTPYEALLKQLGLSTLLNQRLTKIATTVFKTLHNPDAPKCNQDLLTLRKSTYHLRGSNITVLPKVNTTTYGLKSWRYSAAKLWNSLPDPIRRLDNYKSFKKQLRKLNLIGIN